VPDPLPGSTPLTMSCSDGANHQCSGNSVLRTDRGVVLTASGVQAYGQSTSDLATPIVDRTEATGLALASGGWAELRVAKNAGSAPVGATMLITGMNIRWGSAERPPIIEPFLPTQGTARLAANGALVLSALPPSSNLGYYDYAIRGASGTRANYAYNRYFPRTDPPRCPAGYTPCPTVETTGLQTTPGDWRSSGTLPDSAAASRLHEDGDVHAGDAGPGGQWLHDGTGPGVPYPGSKGYRAIELWTYAHANLGSWLTKDTVGIVEWGGTDEHNQNRRGVVAFGAVTPAATLPAAGTATYVGAVRGVHAPDATQEPVAIRGDASVTVDFASGTLTLSVRNTVAASSGAARPLALDAEARVAAVGAGASNYLAGPVDTGSLTGGLGARFFGPVATAGGVAAPPEVGGVLRLSGSGGATAILGFVARRP